METEADLIGLKLMSQACFDPNAAVRVWERMKMADGGAQSSSSSLSEFTSTHPSHESRIKQIKENLPDALRIRKEAHCEEARSFFGKVDQRHPTFF